MPAFRHLSVIYPFPSFIFHSIFQFLYLSLLQREKRNSKIHSPQMFTAWPGIKKELKNFIIYKLRMKIILFIYQWFIAAPILLILTLLTAITTIIGCTLGKGDFWGYYPAQLWSRLFCILSFVRIEVQGRENINSKTSYVFVANHQGAYDIFLIYGYLNHNFKWMMKKSLRNIPFVGKACEAAGHIMVDNSSPHKLKETMEKAENTLKDGMSLVVFPEGARTLDDHIHRFKKGAYQLAVEFNLPVVPLTIDGAYYIMKRGTYTVKPGKIVLTIHKPIYPQEHEGHNLNELMETSYKAIVSALPEKNR